jgi:hypothetical protein
MELEDEALLEKVGPDVVVHIHSGMPGSFHTFPYPCFIPCCFCNQVGWEAQDLGSEEALLTKPWNKFGVLLSSNSEFSPHCEEQLNFS